MIDPLPRPPAPSPRDSPLQHQGRPLRAIAVDIDGTLTDMQRRLDWDAVIALRSAERAGIPVILATGNVIPAVKTIQHCIGTTGPIVCENGGTLYWEIPGARGEPVTIHREVVHGRHEADEVVQELLRRGHTPRPISSDPWRESEAALELASIDEDTVRDVIHDMGKEQLYVVSTGFACHILNRKIDKMTGLQKVLDWLNRHDTRFSHNGDRAQAAPAVGPSEVIAIGDSMNDKELLQGVGVGVALANSPQALKEVADIVTRAKHGAGVREVLEGLGLDTRNQT